jgi:LysR family transcriptional regulator, chromosome initiation inhibitor
MSCSTYVLRARIIPLDCLRDGTVVGADTTQRASVPGCRVESLGVMRCIPVASPAYVERYRHGGFTAEAVTDGESLGGFSEAGLGLLVARCGLQRLHAVPFGQFTS